MFCHQIFEVWQPLKKTVVPKETCLNVIDQRILLIFHFSQLSGIFLVQKQDTCLRRNYSYCLKLFCWVKTNQVVNSRQLQTLNVWCHNMSHLHPIRTCFSSILRCTWWYLHTPGLNLAIYQPNQSFNIPTLGSPQRHLNFCKTCVQILHSPSQQAVPIPNCRPFLDDKCPHRGGINLKRGYITLSYALEAESADRAKPS